MRAHLLLSILLLKRNETLTLLPDANMQRFIRLSYSSHFGILTNSEWQWDSKRISVQKKEVSNISINIKPHLNCAPDQIKGGQNLCDWWKSKADLETDFAAIKKNLFATGSSLTRIINWRLDVKLQTALGWTQNLKVRFFSATGELTSKLCSSVASAKLWMKHLTLSHNLI